MATGLLDRHLVQNLQIKSFCQMRVTKVFMVVELLLSKVEEMKKVIIGLHPLIIIITHIVYTSIRIQNSRHRLDPMVVLFVAFKNSFYQIG